MTALKIITSAAYADPELAAEYGRLPPAFLPIGHQRLYEAQVAMLSALPGRTMLTLPEGFFVSVEDQARLDLSAVEVLFVPTGLTLGQSVLYALELSGIAEGEVCLLHGDTLVDLSEIELGDVIAVAPAPESYHWGAVESFGDLARKDNTEVLAGFFVFSKVTVLRRCLALAQGDFLKALRLYRLEQGLRSVSVESWLDFGHLQTFYRSRCSIRTQRSFNDLEMSFRTVEKSGSNQTKIEAEANWFSQIPAKMRIYTPAYLGSNRNESGKLSYTLEYLPIPTLHELFVFGSLGDQVWQRILQSCAAFLEDGLNNGSGGEKAAQGALQHLVLDKTIPRLEAFASSSGFDLTQEWRLDDVALPSLQRIAEESAARIDFEDERFLGIMHGDFCFPNVFFDFRTRHVRVIDPRGSLDGRELTVFGDMRYDLAKLCHSVIGGYDYILANRYVCTGFAEHNLTLEFPESSAISRLPRIASDMMYGGLRIDSAETLAITTHLFLSMLPLHDDRPDRQRAFVANALRLYRMLETAR